VVRAAQTTEAAAREVAAGLFAAEGPGAAVAASDGSRAAASPSPGTDPVPTAVFAVNDPMAVGVIGAARDHGLEVPRGLSVVGYDDSPLAAYEFISLTSVSGDPRELGEAAGRALVALLEGDADPDPGPASLFTPRLSVRGSAAAPRA
jgi:DNA-binding LacI/PurR family transcriptional regulator